MITTSCACAFIFFCHHQIDLGVIQSSMKSLLQMHHDAEADVNAEASTALSCEAHSTPSSSCDERRHSCSDATTQTAADVAPAQVTVASQTLTSMMTMMMTTTTQMNSDDHERQQHQHQQQQQHFHDDDVSADDEAQQQTQTTSSASMMAMQKMKRLDRRMFQMPNAVELQPNALHSNNALNRVQRALQIRKAQQSRHANEK